MKIQRLPTKKRHRETTISHRPTKGDGRKHDDDLCEHGDVRALCLRFFELGVIAEREAQSRGALPDSEEPAPNVRSLDEYRFSMKVAGRKIRRTRWGELDA